MRGSGWGGACRGVPGCSRHSRGVIWKEPCAVAHCAADGDAPPSDQRDYDVGTRPTATTALSQ